MLKNQPEARKARLERLLACGDGPAGSATFPLGALQTPAS